MRMIGDHNMMKRWLPVFIMKVTPAMMTLMLLILVEDIMLNQHISTSIMMSVIGTMIVIAFLHVVRFFGIPLWFKAIFSSRDKISDDYDVPVLKDQWMKPKTYRNAYSIVGKTLDLFHTYPSTFVTMKDLHDDHDSVFVMIHNPTSMITFTIDNDEVIIATSSPMNVSEMQAVVFVDLTKDRFMPGRNHDYDVHIV